MIEKRETLQILMVEDDPESMNDVKTHLEEDLGYMVVMTASMELLSRLSKECFNLILLDLMIHPNSTTSQGKVIENLHFDGINWRETGLEFLRQLRSGAITSAPEGTPANTPVIIISAVADTVVDTHPEVMKMADRYIEKPFRLEEFDHAIQEILARKT